MEVPQHHLFQYLYLVEWIGVPPILGNLHIQTYNHHYTYIYIYIIICIYYVYYDILWYIYIIVHILWYIYRKSLAKPPPKTYPRLRNHLGCSKPCHLLHSSTRSDLSPRHDLNLTRWWFPDRCLEKTTTTRILVQVKQVFPKKNLVYRCHVQKLQKTSVG